MAMKQVVGFIRDEQTPKVTVGDERIYTLRGRDYKGVMVVILSGDKEGSLTEDVLSETGTNSQDRNRPSDGISKGMGR